MKTIRIKKGLDLPIDGRPIQEVFSAPFVKRVALIGPDYIGLKPKFQVAVGDSVRTGQCLFTDKAMPGVQYTSPGTGKVVAIHRGEKRIFLSIAIELEEENPLSFQSYKESELDSLSPESIKNLLLESGLWTALRERPFEKTAHPDHQPEAIFVTAMDSHPLAPSVARILRDQQKEFENGLKLLAKLTDGTVYLCQEPGEPLSKAEISNVVPAAFKGPHPAGIAGTHIHFLNPVNRDALVWHVQAQDVAAIGKLFTTGLLPVERVISLAGPGVKNPRLLKTRVGASTEDITSGQLKTGLHRAISGSVLHGFTAEGETAFLGRYHQQISVLPEDPERKLLGWLNPGLHLYSVKRIVASHLLLKKRYEFTTLLHGGARSVVPSGGYEKVMPLDILPTHLLKSIAVRDIEDAEKLGALELSEEDLGLCTFVCPAKIDHGLNLRQTLTTIEKEG